MECDEPIEVTPGVQATEDESTEPQARGRSHASLPQPTVHVEVRLTRGSTASREVVCRAVGMYLRAKQGTCNLPTHWEHISVGTSPSEQIFFNENIASIDVRFHSVIPGIKLVFSDLLSSLQICFGTNTRTHLLLTPTSSFHVTNSQLGENVKGHVVLVINPQ